jgi:HK97 gp10 family phage protein
MNVEGLKELDAALAELPKATGKNVMRRAARSALEPFASVASSLAPVGPVRKTKKGIIPGGRLKRSVNVSTALSKRQRRLARRESAIEGKASITVHAGASLVRHAHLVEFGTKERFHKKTGKSVGSMPPRPFMRPAWDSTKIQVLTIFQKEMWAEIKKSADLLARKQARLLAKSKA